MNLAIDIGNTVIKLAIFSNNEIIFKKSFSDLNLQDIKSILEKYPKLNKAILSTVSKVKKDIIDFCADFFDFFIELNSGLKFPFTINYKTPETLGNDRIAAIAGANNIYPFNNILVIDIGTAVTYDFITNKNEYIGGNISPGINLRYKSLHEFTNRLPLLTISNESVPLLGSSTDSAISAGVENGLLYELESYINIYEKKYKDVKIVLTGGDSSLFEKKIKNTIFVHPNLVLMGLNKILEYNATNIQN